MLWATMDAIHPVHIVRSSCTNSFLPVNVKKEEKEENVDVLKRKGKNELSSSRSGGCAAWDSWCLSRAPVSAVAAAPCKPPPNLVGALTLQLGRPMAGNTSVRALGCALPLASDLQHRVRRQECLT